MGIFLLFAIRRHLVSKIVLALMSIMTLLTLWIVIANPVKDCGCFGDAVVLSNGQTFIKNIILLAIALMLLKWPTSMVRFVSKKTQWIVINYTVIFALALSAWSLWDLPLFDFRPYHVGANIAQGMKIPQGAPQPHPRQLSRLYMDFRRLENRADSRRIRATDTRLQHTGQQNG